MTKTKFEMRSREVHYVVDEVNLAGTWIDVQKIFEVIDQLEEEHMQAGLVRIEDEMTARALVNVQAITVVPNTGSKVWCRGEKYDDLVLGLGQRITPEGMERARKALEGGGS